MKKAILYSLSLLVITACTERINVKVNETYTRLVVDGAISTDTSVFHVSLTKSANYFYNQPAPRVTNATVTINDGDSSYLMFETVPGNSGIYRTDPDFHGKTGKLYTLHVTLPQPIENNSEYTASCELVHVAKLDSIRIEIHSDWGRDGIWEIKCYAQDPANEINYYMFNLYRNDTLISDTITKVMVSDDKFFNGNYINGAGVYFINNSEPWMRLHPGDKVTLQMSGITKEYFNFINQVQSAGFNIPFFQGPPANVQGNISSGGVGFFAAYSNSYASTVNTITP